MTKTFQLLWWCCFFTLVTSSIELSWFASLAFNPWARLWDVLMSGIWKNNCSYKRMLHTRTQLQIYNKEWKAPGNENEDDKTKFFRRGRGPGHCLNNTSALFSKFSLRRFRLNVNLIPPNSWVPLWIRDTTKRRFALLLTMITTMVIQLSLWRARPHFTVGCCCLSFDRPPVSTCPLLLLFPLFLPRESPCFQLASPPVSPSTHLLRFAKNKFSHELHGYGFS